jgi:uncharacterized protein YjbI with pentapeptide repeats
MGNLLLEKDLRTSKEDSEVRTLARARTLTVLARMDPGRRQDVMQFLVEAELVQEVEGREPIIGLGGVQLRDVELVETDLRGADLRGAYLAWTKLSGANLRSASLNSAAPFGRGKTDLIYAKLIDADLSYADLRYARLMNANLRGARGITNEELERQAYTLEGATMPNGQKYEDWLKDKEKRQQDE